MKRSSSLAWIALLGALHAFDGGAADRCEPQCATPRSADVSSQPRIDARDLRQVFHNSAVKTIGERVVGRNLTEVRDGIWWERQFSRTATRHIQFYFDEVRSDGAEPFSLDIYTDPQSDLVASYPAAVFASGSTFSTDLLPAGRLRLVLAATSRPAGVSLRWAHAAWQERLAETQPETLVARWDYVRTLPAGTEASRLAGSVAMLHIGPMDAACTGVLIDAATVATSLHCLESSLKFQTTRNAAERDCSDIRIEFDYLTRDRLGTSAVCRGIRAASDALDVALLAVDAAAIRTKTGPRAPVAIRPDAIGAPARLVILHHPVGQPAAIEQNCRARRIVDGDILHDCDTTMGSSGAPLFDEQLRFVGLHFEGAYPAAWTVAMIENDLQFNGPRYNRARSAANVQALLLQK